MSDLNCLHDLYSCTENLFRPPLAQRSLSQEQSKDGFLRLLDACNIAKDALSQTKESLYEIQSSMRRKLIVETEAKKFPASRKSFRKAFGKLLKGLTVTDSTCTFTNGNGTSSVLKEAEAVTVSVFDSIFHLIFGSKLPEKACSRLSLVSKLRSQKHIACEEGKAHANEFAKVAAALHLLEICLGLQKLYY